MRTTINPYYQDKTLSLLTDALIHVHYPGSNATLVALLNSRYSAQYRSPAAVWQLPRNREARALPARCA